METSRLIFGLVILAVGVGLFFVKGKSVEKVARIAGVVGVLVAIGTFLLPSAPESCFCKASTDDETARCLIMAEARAANMGDLTLIPKIFSENAVIFRGDSPNQQSWTGPLTYYKPDFETLIYTSAVHVDIQPVGLRGQTLYYTSGSQGNYQTRDGKSSGSYANPNPSEHWVISKNGKGCWAVERFEFNASHITPFPPDK